MTAKGYCTADEVEKYLGVDLDGETLTQCENLIEAAEAELDGAIGRAWLTGAITNEEYHGGLYNLYVRHTPLTSVDEVRIRRPAETDTETLTVDTDYEVNLETGEIRFLSTGGNWERYEWIWVDYTPVATVPVDIRQATIELVAARLQPAINPALYGVDSVSLPDYSVRYNRAMVGGYSMPPSVSEVVDRYRSEGFG